MGAMFEKKPYYTYEEFVELELPEDICMELLDGNLYAMASPTWEHQGILAAITSQFYHFLRGKPCKVYPGISVRLSQKKDTAFIPDLVLVCDRSKLTDREYNGVPDLIIEILSPSNSRHDTITKFNAYLEARVPEYWIIDGKNRSVNRHRLKDGEYVVSVFSDEDIVPVEALPDFGLELATVFEEAAEGDE